MSINIRPIETLAEYGAVEELQRAVWGNNDLAVVPSHLLLTAQRHGGLVLGAFDENTRLNGFVFSFIGREPDGRVQHCSHMAGVLPGLQNQNLGYRLKLAQREYVLAQGINLITWTYDPLESRNARLNIHKLGATCRTYLPDLYGPLDDELNAGLPTDRFEVEWHIDSDHVKARLSNPPRTSVAALQMRGTPLLDLPSPGALSHSDEVMLPTASERFLFEIPSNYQTIKATNMQLAQAWRLYTRTIFETAFSEGYTVTDLLVEGSRCYYLLEKGEH